jgi:hypothetical protein
MFALFRAITERLKALFPTGAALELESELLARDAERRAEWLRQDDRYENEGLHGIAQHLRQQAEQVSVQRPLAGVLPAVAHLQLGPADNAGTPPLPTQDSDNDNGTLPGLDTVTSRPALPHPRKKGGKP